MSQRNASFLTPRDFNVHDLDSFSFRENQPFLDTFTSVSENLIRSPQSSDNRGKQALSLIPGRESLEFINNFVPSFNEGNPYLKVLHLTDIHFDPTYKEGTSAVCEAPICCMAESGAFQF